MSTMEKWAALGFILLSACSGTTPAFVSDAGNDAAADGGSCECSGVSTCCDGCHAVNNAAPCNDGLSCTASSACETGACVGTAAMCPVTWSECQARTCSEVAGCGVATNIREGFDCNDGNANTYDDTCQSGTCAGTVYACTVNNGGCGAATCIGNDPAPPTCQCSGRYNVTASEVTDTTTSLVWERAASATTYTHANALTHCSGMGGGWRLPTKDELAGIVTGIVGPRIDACAFPSTASELFWSSTTVSGMAGKFWGSDFASGGNVGGESGDDGSVPHLARCVR